MNRETRTRWYNHKCSKCSAHPFVIIIRIVLYALVRYLRPTLYTTTKKGKKDGLESGEGDKRALEKKKEQEGVGHYKWR